MSKNIDVRNAEDATIFYTRSRTDPAGGILADSGSVRNLIDESVFKKLPCRHPIRPLGDVTVIGGNGEALDLLWFTVLQCPSARHYCGMSLV